MQKKNIWVGLSGGVDSSVTAALLQEEGHELTGVYLKCWEDALPDGQCPWRQDQADAKAVADQLGIPFRSINLVPQYRERVFQYMVDEYAAGRTPNPDVVCNREIKFGLFLEEALANGADAVATGHYVQREGETLLVGADANKDQSYFLWQLTPEMTRHAMFPIGHLHKEEVRAIAKERGFPTAEKPDSTGVCFVGEVPMQQFLEQFIEPSPGPVLTVAGKKVGEHRGLQYYTIGQRRGLGVYGGGPPYYVARKDAAQNALIVAAPADEITLFADELVAGDVNWIGGEPPEIPGRVMARIRYRQPLQEAALSHEDATHLRVRFTAPQRAVTPGQSIVFYLPQSKHRGGDVMLGGGVIR